MMANPPESAVPETLLYATPIPVRGRVGAGIAIVLGGLGLIVLGGCFLIGVMLLVTHDFAVIPAPLTSPEEVLMFALYALAILCFSAAGLVLFVGLRALLRTLRS